MTGAAAAAWVCIFAPLAGALATARARQESLEGGAERLRGRKRAKAGK